MKLDRIQSTVTEHEDSIALLESMAGGISPWITDLEGI